MWLLLLGCASDAVLEDNTAQPGRGFDGDLNSPYALGAVFDVRLDLKGPWELDDWEIVSDDPSVILLNPQPSTDPVVKSEATAVGVGQTTLRVFNHEGEQVTAVEVHVHDPVALTLSAQVIDHNALDTPLIHLQQHQTEVRWIVRALGPEDQVLAGLPEPSLSCDPDVQGVLEQGTKYAESDWFVATTVGGTEVQRCTLTADELVTTVQVQGVDKDVITRVELLHAPSPDPESREVWVVAWDADDAVVLGAGADWRWQSAAEPGQAFSYVFSAEEPVTQLTANIEVDPFWLYADIQASTGSVAPENTRMCGTGVGGAGWAGVLAMLALLRRRRDMDAAI